MLSLIEHDQGFDLELNSSLGAEETARFIMATMQIKGYEPQDNFSRILEPDGLIGQNTLAALNVSVEDRIRQILLNLERRRWMADDPGPRYVFVNLADFELKVVFKLTGDRAKANAGIQFRTKRIPKHHEVSGYQADMGQGYWGALYDESRRNKVLAQPDAKVIEKLVKHDDWNEYVIRCEGPRIRLTLNGTQTVDYTEPDDKIDRTGVIGLQVHGGAKAKVYYKSVTIEELK